MRTRTNRLLRNAVAAAVTLTTVTAAGQLPKKMPSLESNLVAARDLDDTAGDACSASVNPTHCFMAGAFTASIVRVNRVQWAGYEIVRLELQFRNVSERPIALAYHAGTARAVDRQGNVYNGRDDLVSGMPTDWGQNFALWFALQPGEGRMASFEVVGHRTAEKPVSLDYDMTLDELGTERPWTRRQERAVIFRDINPAMPVAK